MKKLYSFYWDCGRMGSVEGLFVAEEHEVKSWIGHRVYFGEILGKHSEIYGTLEEKDLDVISDDQEKIEWLVKIIGSRSISGYNPLDYIRVSCYNCDWPICEDGYWYDFKIIDDNYYCACYNKETEECNHEDE